MTDLQACEVGGSTKKTLWQPCQLVDGQISGEMTEQRESEV